MPYAMTLRLDEADRAPFDTLMHALAAHAGADEAAELRHTPRIILAAYPDDADAKALATTAAALSAQWKRLPVRFASLGIFPGDPASLWLAPITNSALLVRHAHLLARHAATGPWASGVWIPHLMLCAALPGAAALAAATAAANGAFTPFTATLSDVELIRTAPQELVFSAPLAPN